MIPPEQVPSRYADEVWTRSATNSRLSRLRYHTDRSCSRLRAEGRPIFRRSRDALTPETQLCEFCDPACATPNNKNTKSESIGRSMKHTDTPRQVLEEHYD
jgi:hypothetical protein